MKKRYGNLVRNALEPFTEEERRTLTTLLLKLQDEMAGVSVKGKTSNDTAKQV